MPLTITAEQAFNEAIEAAYAMKDAEHSWGRQSEELAVAVETYRIAVKQYYAVTGTHRERFWDKFCRDQPSALECRMYEV